MTATRTVQAPPHPWYAARRRFALEYIIRFADGKVEAHTVVVIAGDLLAALLLARRELADDGGAAMRLLSWTSRPDED